MLEALQYLVYFLVLTLGVAGVLANVVVVVVLSNIDFTVSTSWGYGYFPSGGSVVILTCWPGLLLFDHSFHDRLSIVLWVAGVVFFLPLFIAFWKPVYTFVLTMTGENKIWTPKAKDDENEE